MASQLALLFVPPAARCPSAGRPRPGPRRQGRRAGSTARSTRSAPRSASRPTPPTGSRPSSPDRPPKEAFAEADLVIEAVFEELGVKKQVFAEVEAVVKPDCVLMTNTSSLSVTDMAADLEHPERVVGFHFFNPVAVLPLVEVVRARADRRRHARDGVRRRQGAQEVLRARQGRAGVRRQPAAHPVPRRGHQGRRRGHPGRGRRPRARPARPADVAVRAPAARRPGRRAARGRDPARGVPRAVPASRRTCAAGRGRHAPGSTAGTSAAAVRRRRDEGAAASRATRRSPRSRSASARSARSPRRSASCSTRASSPSRRTSTSA